MRANDGGVSDPALHQKQRCAYLHAFHCHSI
jgi:hypothetical protein